jgi:hypothetical protein
MRRGYISRLGRNVEPWGERYCSPATFSPPPAIGQTVLSIRKRLSQCIHQSENKFLHPSSFCVVVPLKLEFVVYDDYPRRFLMAVWTLLLIVFGAGLIGGVINALMSDNGFMFPKQQDGILRPGWIGNALIGGVAAAISWSLYGPLAGVSIVAATGEGTAATGELTLAAVGGATLVGIAGARWLTNEVDKSLLRAAGVEAAKRNPTDELVTKLATASPAAALQAAQGIRDAGPVLKRQ